jgi:hypothetical protein
MEVDKEELPPMSPATKNNHQPEIANGDEGSILSSNLINL